MGGVPVPPSGGMWGREGAGGWWCVDGGQWEEKGLGAAGEGRGAARRGAVGQGWG